VTQTVVANRFCGVQLALELLIADPYGCRTGELEVGKALASSARRRGARVKHSHRVKLTGITTRGVLCGVRVPGLQPS